MIIDDITDCLIQKVIDDGGQVYAFNGTDRFNVVSAGNSQITIDSGTQQFNVGEKISFIYVPKYKSPYCESYADTDNDGIIDLVDLDIDGDGVIDERKPFSPTFIVAEIKLAPDAPNNVTLLIEPAKPSLARAREWGSPLVVDRYYPLYMTEDEALAASPLSVPAAHSHELSSHDELGDNWTYWMPLGVSQWHGNYATCKPDDPSENNAVAINTYDFEYVDRISGSGLFAPIIPYDYVSRLLGIDRDENGIFDEQVQYELIDKFNVLDELDLNGNLITEADMSTAHFNTIPAQVWNFEVTQKRASESVLVDQHSFYQGNFVYDLRTFSKFDIGTTDSDNHSLSKFGYYSTLRNGNNAQFDSNNSIAIYYLHDLGDGTDEWRNVIPLEVNSNGYVVLDDDLFDLGSRFYLVEKYPPAMPSSVSASSTNPVASITNVQALRMPEAPSAVSNVIGRYAPAPDVPSFVFAGIAVADQEIIWEQFIAGSDVGRSLPDAPEITNVDGNYIDPILYANAPSIVSGQNIEPKTFSEIEEINPTSSSYPRGIYFKMSNFWAATDTRPRGGVNGYYALTQGGYTLPYSPQASVYWEKMYNLDGTRPTRTYDKNYWMFSTWVDRTGNYSGPANQYEGANWFTKSGYIITNNLAMSNDVYLSSGVSWDSNKYTNPWFAARIYVPNQGYEWYDIDEINHPQVASPSSWSNNRTKWLVGMCNVPDLQEKCYVWGNLEVECDPPKPVQNHGISARTDQFHDFSDIPFKYVQWYTPDF